MKIHPIIRLVKMLANQRLPRKRKYNKSRLSKEDILKYREKINDKDYLNTAIEEMAGRISGGVE